MWDDWNRIDAAQRAQDKENEERQAERQRRRETQLIVNAAEHIVSEARGDPEVVNAASPEPISAPEAVLPPRGALPAAGLRGLIRKMRDQLLPDERTDQ